MTRKERHEMALKVEKLMGGLPVHEQAAVLQMVGIDLQADAKNEELARLAQTPPPTIIADEHYRQ